jgi:hypothetical protein
MVCGVWGFRVRVGVWECGGGWGVCGVGGGGVGGGGGGGGGLGGGGVWRVDDRLVCANPCRGKGVCALIPNVARFLIHPSPSPR